MIIYQPSIFNNKILAKEKPPNFKKPQFLPNRGLTTWLWASQFLTNCKSYGLKSCKRRFGSHFLFSSNHSDERLGVGGTKCYGATPIIHEGLRSNLSLKKES